MIYPLTWTFSSSRRDWILQFNIALSILILLFRSQHEHIAWAPVATGVVLLAWGATGFYLLVIHQLFLLNNWKTALFYTLHLWIGFLLVLRPPPPDAGLYFPVSITAVILCCHGPSEEEAIEQGNWTRGPAEGNLGRFRLT